MAEILERYEALKAELARTPESDGAKRHEINMEIAYLKNEYREEVMAGRI